MKTNTHPNYYAATVICACGSTFTTRATKKEIKLEICSACHPFFTGKQRLVDTAGRVERFQKRFSKTEGQTVKRKPKTKVKKLQSLATTRRRPKVLSTEIKAGDKKDAKGKKAAKKD
ncbi:MAG: 50S ribosomal protein L31 [Elusimicrobia bacterium]|nr:MAG: 50S ribosomal protein L31 [Elusimicrobiota bacterium]